MKKFFIAILAALILSSNAVTSAKEVEVPEDVYTWVQSTARGNYFFNHQQMNYDVKSDGTIDLYTLNVPTICTYDDVQIQDVVQKRRWKMQSTEGYEILAGRADYLKFDFRNGTVQIVRRVDLDNTFTELDSDISGEPVKFADVPRTSVACRLYRTILIWARFNNDTLIERSRGKLSKRDEKLNEKDYPINKITLPGDVPAEELEENKVEVKPSTTDRTERRVQDRRYTNPHTRNRHSQNS